MKKEITLNKLDEFTKVGKEVNGKRVFFRERLPLKESREIPALVKGIVPEDIDTQVKILVCVVDRWEFDGEPSDPKAYEDLDIFSEIMPMIKLAGEYVAEKMGYDAKN